jgi:hypothetical protein
MNTYKEIMKRRLILILLIAAFLPLSCEDSIADMRLDGQWIAVGGIRLELKGGSYVKIQESRIENAAMRETGTFTADGKYITFNRVGFSPDTFEYKLEYPKLTIDVNEYWHDSPGAPIKLEGRWTPYPAYGSAVIFDEALPKKGNPGVYEGDYMVYMIEKGKYTISNRNLPGNSVLISTPSHVHGSRISAFVEESLQANVIELFDLSYFTIPNNNDSWWFTMDEVRRLFEIAAKKATKFEDESYIISAMEYFFEDHRELIYDYTVEFDDDIVHDYEVIEAEKDNKLTLRYNTFYGPMIYTYFLIKDDFGEIGGTGTPDPTKPWDPEEF